MDNRGYLKREIVLIMNDGVECGTYDSVTSAYKALQELKALDKEEKVYGNEYYFELHEHTEDTVYISDYKIYRRGNKLFGRPYNRVEKY